MNPFILFYITLTKFMLSHPHLTAMLPADLQPKEADLDKAVEFAKAEGSMVERVCRRIIEKYHVRTDLAAVEAFLDYAYNKMRQERDFPLEPQILRGVIEKILAEFRLAEFQVWADMGKYLGLMTVFPTSDSETVDGFLKGVREVILAQAAHNPIPTGFFGMAKLGIWMSRNLDVTELELMSVAEKKFGEDVCNEWLCRTLAATGQYKTDGKEVEPA